MIVRKTYYNENKKPVIDEFKDENDKDVDDLMRILGYFVTDQNIPEDQERELLKCLRTHNVRAFYLIMIKILSNILLDLEK